MSEIASLYKKFGFNEPPFNQTPDTNFLFKSKKHIAALDHLEYGLRTDGFTLLTGSCGLGKTLLCRQILRTAGKKIKTVYIHNTCCSMLDIYKVIYYDLTGNQLESDSSARCFHEINQLLLRLAGEGKRVVVLVDEAQGLKPELLEGLRQLSNLETEKRKLLSFILIGQPELEILLANHNLRQMEQRISVRYVLKPFKLTETMEYIYHRLWLSTNSAISDTSYYFTIFAICLVHWYSRGVPRRINQICDRVLLASFNTGKKVIGAFTVFRAAREIMGKHFLKNVGFARYSGFVKIAVILIISGLAMYVGLDRYQDTINKKKPVNPIVEWFISEQDLSEETLNNRLRSVGSRDNGMDAGVNQDFDTVTFSGESEQETFASALPMEKNSN